ncbi:hypothetical protein Salat_1442800 [Sesamum alatum]|uniref:Uncharacterized protein n=1 Tax=Sesamum alatum TaxID=300844 RepID=A0AAE2CLM2_9LAMI|nr:hypothetical protein Salat_1442800 [Sesamum alatum]
MGDSHHLLLEHVLDFRGKGVQSETMVSWSRQSPMKATWENLDSILTRFPHLSLEDKTSPDGVGNNTPYQSFWPGGADCRTETVAVYMEESSSTQGTGLCVASVLGGIVDEQNLAKWVPGVEVQYATYSMLEKSVLHVLLRCSLAR